NIKIPIEPTPSDPLHKIQQEKIREQIQSRLKDDEERLVYYLSFESGLKPRQIAEKYAKQFENAKQVSRIKERIVKRLRDDLQLRSLWEGLK
ncbi:MAG: hypothetical protein ACPGWR_19350, partial [Ardenticatenaceae bacterium]